MLKKLREFDDSVNSLLKKEFSHNTVEKKVIGSIEDRVEIINKLEKHDTGQIS